MLDRLAPAVFVLLWSTGWIVAKYAAVHADPITFLAVRHALTAVAFAGLALAMGASWPQGRTLWGRALFCGIFLHGLYLAGVWYAIGRGVPAGLSGVIAGLQPLLTAMAAPLFLGERLTRVQKIGLGLGFSGILIAISPQLLDAAERGLSGLALPVAINLIAMVSVTYGTLYQKRHLQDGNLLSIACLQFIGAFIVTLPLALSLETVRFDWTGEAIAAMAWSVLGLSVAAVALLLYLIRRGQVSRAASLIYLMPPMVAIEAAILFGEPLTPPMVIGTLIVVAGVWMVGRATPKEKLEPVGAQ
ncbi:DMT family transporter [Neorhizobium sp. NPDC001467]|uniref:DMT family transporter n=1 Tax=Neorhizobium sp. NPDC001467 TaxID=3390595 RepID=UPI003D074D52